MASSVYTAQDAAYWYVPLARAIPAAALACVITFAGGNYTPTLGLLSFGTFALISGLVAFIVNLRALPGGVDRLEFLIQSVVSVVAGAVAIALFRGGLPVLLTSIGVWAVVTGILELFAGVRARRRIAAARDWIFIGALTTVFAIVVLVIPPDYVQHYTGSGGGPRILNASVMVVGGLAVYGAIVAVYLVIAALSLKWGPSPTAPKEIAS